MQKQSSVEPKPFRCCICRKLVREYGNNPRPLAGKRCCNMCDANIVIPVRMYIDTELNS